MLFSAVSAIGFEVSVGCDGTESGISMRRSKLAVFHGPGRPLTIDEVELPVLREGQILVRNEYTTLCRSDLTTYTGKRTEKTPTILGHEIVGRIEEFGLDAPESDCRGDPLKVGDRITWGIYASDPESYLSRMGIPQKGDGLFKYGHEEIRENCHLHGGLSEYCILRKHTPIIRIGEPIPLPVIALLNCSVATVAGAIRLAGSIEGRDVLVAGVGMLGIIACAVCKIVGAGRIVGIDIDEERIKTARSFGADITVNLKEEGLRIEERLTSDLGGKSIQAALDFSGIPETMELALSLLGIGGVAVWVGATFPQRDLRVNAEKVVRNLHVLKGLHNYNQEDLVFAVNFMERHYKEFPFESLVQGEFDLDSVNESFEYAVSSGAHRVGLTL